MLFTINIELKSYNCNEFDRRYIRKVKKKKE